MKYINAFYDDNIFTIVTEKVPLALNEIVISNEKDLKIFIKQLLIAIKYLHENNIFNLNIKEANILITKNGVLKI